ncbi:MAG TPA: tetratricopeptide repeat protein [Polyangiaceae bacterium]
MCAVVLCFTGHAWAQEASPDELARRHFESGVAYLQESDYDNALKAFEKSYALSRRPEILLNVATVHERKGNLKRAVTALQQYLDAAPEGEGRVTVETRIKNLEKRIQEEPAPSPAATPPPRSSPPRRSRTKQSPPPAAPKAEDPNRLPAYVVLGIGGLSAIGAGVTGLLARSEYDDAEGSCAPSCSDDEVSSGKSLALTSTVLTGVAVVGVGVGAALYFMATPKRQSAARATPRVLVGAGPRGAAAHASWSF